MTSQLADYMKVTTSKEWLTGRRREEDEES